MVHKSHPLPMAFVSWLIKSIQFRNRQNKIRMRMSFANSHILCGYKPVELHRPHQSHTDFHPWRICPCRAKATWCPRGTPRAPWGSSWRWDGFSLPWLWKYAVQQHVKVEMWYPALGLGSVGAVLGGKSSRGYAVRAGTMTSFQPPDICILYSPFSFGQPNFHKAEWLFHFWEIKPSPSQF